jgi:hypothetical protein
MRLKPKPELQTVPHGEACPYGTAIPGFRFAHPGYVLVEIEAAFKNLKGDLQLRPIYHQHIERIEAHIFVALLPYCLHVTLRAKLKPLASGLTPRAVLDKFAAIQMLDVHFPTTDRRTLILRRTTELNADQKLLVRQLGLNLPPQPPPRITAAGQIARTPAQAVS